MCVAIAFAHGNEEIIIVALRESALAHNTVYSLDAGGAIYELH